MALELNTQRMIGVPICKAHTSDMVRLHADYDVAKTLSANGKPISYDQTVNAIAKAERHWLQNGFGLWAFYLNSNRSFIGRGGLISYVLDDCKVTGLAYAVCSAYWGKGYATEMAKASLNFAFNNLHKRSVASWALPNNIASQRIMEKLGFKYEYDFTFAGLKHRFYFLKDENFSKDT